MMHYSLGDFIREYSPRQEEVVSLRRRKQVPEGVLLKDVFVSCLFPAYLIPLLGHHAPALTFCLSSGPQTTLSSDLGLK